MIVATPKPGTLFSLGLFILICLGLATYAYFGSNGVPSMLEVVVIMFTLPLAFGILIKTLLGWKKIKVGKERIEVHYPFRAKSTSFSLKEVEQWKTVTIKTIGAKYQELSISYGTNKLAISKQEYQSYDKIVSYLRKKIKSRESK